MPTGDPVPQTLPVMANGAPIVTATPPQQQRSLVKKVAEIMGEISRVKKTGHNKFQDYNYVTEADILDAVRNGMASRSLVLLPNVLESVFGQIGKQRLCTLTVAFTLEDGDSGETRVVHMMGEGTDVGDKASYKAMTGAEKYALMKLFLIPTGDDPEKDDPREHSAPPQQRQAKPSAPLRNNATPPPVDGATSEEWDRATAKAPLVVDVKPGETETDAVARQTAIRLRANRLYKRLVPRATTPDGFQEWAKRLVGKAKSSEWESGDLDQLEAAAPDMERGLAEAKP